LTIEILYATLLKLLAIGLTIWLLALAPARAEFCRTIEGQRICILDIKRSAKNYWQYQALVSINGATKGRASYDCRERLITDPDGNLSSFRLHPEGRVVCSLYRRRG
jgi:hypothetical protein